MGKEVSCLGCWVAKGIRRVQRGISDAHPGHSKHCPRTVSLWPQAMRQDSASCPPAMNQSMTRVNQPPDARYCYLNGPCLRLFATKFGEGQTTCAETMPLVIIPLLPRFSPQIFVSNNWFLLKFIFLAERGGIQRDVCTWVGCPCKSTVGHVQRA